MNVPDSSKEIDSLDLCFCGASAAKQIDETIPLCRYHFAQAATMWRRHEQYIEKWLREERGLKQERKAPVVRRRGGSPVVYYVAMNGHVKIGTTKSFVERMSALYVQPDDVLAIEPGGQPLESSRHQQFQTFRIGRTELFRHNGILDELISDLASRYPHPWTAACRINSPQFDTDWITPAQAQREDAVLRRMH